MSAVEAAAHLLQVIGGLSTLLLSKINIIKGPILNKYLTGSRITITRMTSLKPVFH
jgi:hypothetical protein